VRGLSIEKAETDKLLCTNNEHMLNIRCGQSENMGHNIIELTPLSPTMKLVDLLVVNKTYLSCKLRRDCEGWRVFYVEDDFNS